MKIKQVLLRLFDFYKVDLEEQQLQVGLALIGQHQFCALFKGHGDITIEAAAFGIGEQGRLEGYRLPQGRAKEVAEGDVYGGCGGAGPIKPQTGGRPQFPVAVVWGEPKWLYK